MNKFVLGLATILHLMPLPFGVSSVGATALYAGAYGPARSFWAVPILLLVIGNLIFGFYEPIVLASVYAGFALSSVAGRWLLHQRRNRVRFSAAVIGGATIFFIISNFSIWYVGYYPATANGLLECYVRGLPYFGQAILADAAFGMLLFGLHAFLERRQVEPLAVQ